jgi:hypothetical protein
MGRCLMRQGLRIEHLGMFVGLCDCFACFDWSLVSHLDRLVYLLDLLKCGGLFLTR